MLENKINKHCQLFSYSEIFSQKWEVTPQKSYMRYIWIHSCCKNNLKYKKSRSPILIVIMWCNVMCSVQLSSVAQSCPTLCDCMNRSTPGLPVHHQLPEFTQTHIVWVSDVIQPSYLLLSPFPPATNPSQHQGLFQWVNSSHEVAKVLEFQLQHQSFQRTPRTDLP